MTTESLRKLNATGLAAFTDYLTSGASGPAPVSLLTDMMTSEPLGKAIFPAARQFANRYEFGEYLVDLLSLFDPHAISLDRGLWSALALVWFDQLCPPDAQGKRKVAEAYRYVLSSDYKHYYRHLVRMPWQLVRDHGANSRFMLLAAKDGTEPLRRHGEMVEQLGAVQSILRSRAIIGLASRLYGDPSTGRPKPGSAGKGAGSVRRLGAVLQQIDLTFDVDVLPEEEALSILPREFNVWKGSAVRRQCQPGSEAAI
jgi:hypothetical protein